MKKILIIDDVVESEISRISTYKEQFKDWLNLIDFQLNFDNVLKFDRLGNEVVILDDAKYYDFIFIHNSYGDSKLPSNWNEMLNKHIICTKIYTFSGGITGESDIEKRIIERNILFDNLNQFLKFSTQVNEFYPLSLYVDNYDTRFSKSKLNKLRKLNTAEEIIKAKDFQQLCDVLGTTKINYYNIDKAELIEQLQNQIKIFLE